MCKGASALYGCPLPVKKALIVLEFHRQSILTVLTVVCGIDGENVFLPSGQLCRVILSDALDLDRVSTAQCSDETFSVVFVTVQLYKDRQAACQLQILEAHKPP